MVVVRCCSLLLYWRYVPSFLLIIFHSVPDSYDLFQVLQTVPKDVKYVFVGSTRDIIPRRVMMFIIV